MTEDEAHLRAQLDPSVRSSLGNIELALEFGINTDAMISGAACTLGYTGDVLGPHLFENHRGVITKNDIAGRNFEVIVGGEAYGTGSSREAAVVAHQGAGISLVVARSFQRIFQENMVYCGLPFTTDFSVLAALEAGESVDDRVFTQALPPLFRDVAESGGLLAYGSRLLAEDLQPRYRAGRPPGPMTCVEKIVAGRTFCGHGQPAGVRSVQPGEQVLCEAGFRGMHEYTTAMVMHLYHQQWGDAPIERPESVAAFEDHFVLLDNETVPTEVRALRLAPAQALRRQMIEACEARNIRIHGPGRRYPAGVCHRVVVEDYAVPGTVVVLTDSHSPTAGVLNTFAFGVGSTAMAFALRTGLVPVTVPQTVRVVIQGDARGVLSAKDLILHLIGDPFFRNEAWRSSPTDTCVVQFAGSALEQWDVDELSVLTNMTVEGGLMTGIVEPCEPIRQFLKARRSAPADIESQFVYPDDDAPYAHTIEVDLGRVPLTVATPGDARNRAPLSEHTHVDVHNVVIASCTGGSLADLRAAGRILKGRAVKRGVRMTVTPASEDVARAAHAEGLLAHFRALGAEVTPPGCGACIGNGPGIPRQGETTASTTNRNFDRRMGAPGPVYLVSPAVAAATAVTGKLTDPRTL